MDDYQKKLDTILQTMGPIAVAVSGGVDSLTIAAYAFRLVGQGMTVFHAVSPAVPSEATQRTTALAAERGWPLIVVNAGEFNDERYRSNPVNRCFFCKSNLYTAIAALTTSQIISGANADDLNDYRPGLQAAAEHGVRHPFVEAGVKKSDIRLLARTLGLGNVAELPAAPCLSSRVETGIRIQEDDLARVHRAEKITLSLIPAASVRCRIRNTGVVVEIDSQSLADVRADILTRIATEVGEVFSDSHRPSSVTIEPYRTGSAFVHTVA